VRKLAEEERIRKDHLQDPSIITALVSIAMLMIYHCGCWDVRCEPFVIVATQISLMKDEPEKF
jgi:hypothetical protein